MSFGKIVKESAIKSLESARKLILNEFPKKQVVIIYEVLYGGK